jgi:hypothetical protein
MKTALLLSGLQRNHFPFVQNQLNMLINHTNFDIFICTSNENNHRVCSNENKDIRYVQANEFANDDKYFFDLYGDKLKSVSITNETLFANFKSTYIKAPITNFHNGIISSYFKIYSGLQMIEDYELTNDIKYDNIIRMRMDGFLLSKFDVNLLSNLKNNQLIASKSNQKHEDDSCFIVKCELMPVIKDFLFALIDEAIICASNIVVEQSFFKYCRLHDIEITFITNLICRIGVLSNYNIIPYLSYTNFLQLKSLEYPLHFGL